ncbi:MAG: peroxidase-related enzyme [Brachybacterium sp.]|uniref:peroxidase-related enzyme n=1 Tax=Brachybacterium sp. TaxID=1891286 RepID=UPI002654627E|nr:peroxidase-related enzyme [Brachybacterium sp.]MDN6302666.1 peroxidase-related enzyme [Brachybacterium sp.]MDN6328380.1 peroxidase-related enzyme [Brachybacterium sp.]
MTSLAAPADTQLLLDALLADAPEGRDALEVLRPEVLAHTRAAYGALYREPQALPIPVLHALAAVTADWQGSGPLAEWHRAQGASAALTVADPLTEEPALAALRDHVDLLSISPALVTQADQEHLAAAGHDPRTAVLISQLVAFESYLQRLVAGLAALHGLEVPAADAPVRAPRSRGRIAQHGGTTPSGRARPSAFTREQLQWEPWIDVPAEDELTDEQRDSFASKASTNSVYFRMLSLTPAITRARSELDNAIFLPRDGLPKAERELAAAATSKVNDCIYCASVHARKAAALAKRESEVDALLAAELERDADWIASALTPLAAGQDERWSALVTAAAELSRPRPSGVPIAPLRALGLSDPEIADLLGAAAFFAWANRLMLSLGDPALPDTP